MTQKYFNQLNYTLGNEDTSVDVELVTRLESKSIFNVAGCGSRGFPLLASGDVEHITMGDVSPYQLALCRLREALYRHCDFQEFLLFFEFPPYHSQDNTRERKKIFSRLELSDPDRSFFKGLFEEISWQSLLYSGKWEKTFQTLSLALQTLLGKERERLFDHDFLEDQRDYFFNEFPQGKWKALLFVLGNKSVFNALLYKGDFIKKNVKENHFQYYKQSFDQLFENNLARKSFFAHLCFYGKIIHSDGNPIEAIADNFEKVKKALEEKTETAYLEGNLVEKLQDDFYREKFDYLGLSDVPSYFSGEVEKNFLQDLRKCVKKGGVICLRNYLRIPEADTTGFVDITHEHGDLFPKEKVGVYRFQLFRRS